MEAKEIKQALADAVAPAGKDATAHIGISSHGSAVYVSAEASWRPGSDKMTGCFVETVDEAIAAVRVWAAESPMRNRVMCADDIGLAGTP